VQNISDNKLNVKRIVNKSTPMPDVWEDEFTATP